GSSPCSGRCSKGSSGPMQKFDKRLGVFKEAPPPSIEELARFPILRSYDEPFLKRIQPHTLLLHVDKGDIILREGEYGDSAYYIVKGAVEVILPDALRKKAGEIPTRPSKRRGGPATVASGAQAIVAERGASPGAGQLPGRPVRSDTVILTSLPADIVGNQRILLGEGEIFGEISALSRYPQ